MCLGIPMQIVALAGHCALCRDREGRTHRIDLLLTGPQPEGSWLMTWNGVAREPIDAERARRGDAALSALQALMDGETPDLDAAFADLLARGPRLPECLQGAAIGQAPRADPPAGASRKPGAWPPEPV